MAKMFTEDECNKWNNAKLSILPKKGGLLVLYTDSSSLKQNENLNMTFS